MLLYYAVVDLSVLIWLVGCILTIIVNIKLFASFVRGCSGNISYLPTFFLILLLVFMEPLVFIIGDGQIPTLNNPQARNPGAELQALALTCFFCGVILILKRQRSKVLTGMFGMEVTSPNSSVIFMSITVVFFVIGIYPYIASGDSLLIFLLAGRSVSAFSQFDVVGAGNTNFLPHLTNFIVGVGVLTGYMLLNRKFVSTAVYGTSILLFSTTLVFLASGGGRTRLGFVVAPLLIYYFMRSKSSFSKQIKGFGLLILTVLLISYMVQVRNQGVLDTLEVKAVSLEGNNLNRELVLISEHYTKPIGCDNMVFCMVMPYIDTLNKFISNPIPRAYFEGKYLDPSFADYNILRTGSSGFEQTSNVTATSFGRYYILYGWWGVLAISLIIAYFLRVIARKIEKETSDLRLLLLAQWAYFLGQSVRDFNPGWLYPVLFTHLVYVVVSHYSDLKSRIN